MAFTAIKITGTIDIPDDEPAGGTIIAALSENIVNNHIVVSNPVQGIISAKTGEIESATGAEPFIVVANDDPETEPSNSYYNFTIKPRNSPAVKFAAVVPHTAENGEIGISALLK